MRRTIHNPILNGTVTFLRTATDSGGTITELEATVMPGGGNPPHFHGKLKRTMDPPVFGWSSLDISKCCGAFAIPRNGLPTVIPSGSVRAYVWQGCASASSAVGLHGGAGRGSPPRAFGGGGRTGGRGPPTE